MSLFEAASGLAGRYLSREQLTVLRSQYYRVRTTFTPLLRVAYGTFDAAGLRAHLEARIQRDFEIFNSDFQVRRHLLMTLGQVVHGAERRIVAPMRQLSPC